MMTSKRIFTVILVFIASYVEASADIQKPLEGGDLEGLRNYQYLGIGGELQGIEVYSPPAHTSADNRPCFIFFHGGGWSSGGLNQGRNYCNYFASRGIVAMTVDYTLTSEADLQAMGLGRKTHAVIDAKTLVRWVKCHSANLGVDPNKIIAGGHSAGAHISVLQMMDEVDGTSVHWNPTDDRSISTEVAALVLLTPAITENTNGVLPEFSAIEHVDKQFPPTLIIAGQTDWWRLGATELGQALVDADQHVEAWLGIGLGHGFHLGAQGFDQSLYRIDTFLAGLGFLNGDPTVALPPGEAPFGLEFWNAPLDSVHTESRRVQLPDSDDFQIEYRLNPHLPPLSHHVEISNSLNSDDWRVIEPNITLGPVVNDFLPLTVSGLKNAASNVGLNTSESFYTRVISTRDHDFIFPLILGPNDQTLHLDGFDTTPENVKISESLSLTLSAFSAWSSPVSATVGDSLNSTLQSTTPATIERIGSAIGVNQGDSGTSNLLNGTDEAIIFEVDFDDEGGSKFLYLISFKGDLMSRKDRVDVMILDSNNHIKKNQLNRAQLHRSIDGSVLISSQLNDNDKILIATSSNNNNESFRLSGFKFISSSNPNLALSRIE